MVGNEWPQGPARPHWHWDPWTTVGHYGPSLHIAIDLVYDGWLVLPYITPPRAMVLMVLRCSAVRALASLANALKKMPAVVPDL